MNDRDKSQILDAFPWAKHFDDGALDQFRDELQWHAIHDGREELDGAPVEKLLECVAAWRITSGVYADPELLAALTAPIKPEDLEVRSRPVRKPEVS